MAGVPAPKRPTAFAFFDFDHTLLDADAGPLFGKHLFLHRRQRIRERRPGLGGSVARGGLWLRYLPFVSWMGLQAGLYKLGARRRSSIVRSAYRGLRGVPAHVFRERLADFVSAHVPPLLFPEMMDEMNRHHREGRRCVIVTTGMEPLVSLALPHLPPGVDLIGCRLDERDGRLTGRVEGPLYGADKANIIHAYCRAAGIRPADCWAYSDHWSDVQMLEAVGHAVVVNPRRRLRAWAVREGWKVVETEAGSTDYQP